MVRLDRARRISQLVRGPWNDYDGPIHAARRMEGAPMAELAGMLADEIGEVSAALAREAGAE